MYEEFLLELQWSCAPSDKLKITIKMYLTHLAYQTP